MTDYTFQTATAVELDVRLHASDLQVHASDRADVVVTITPRDGSSKAQDVIDRVQVFQENARIVIDDKHNRSSRRRGLAFDVRVDLPASSAVSVQIGAGHVESTGVLGAVRLRAGAGNAHLAACGAADVASGAGDIEIAVSTGGARIKSGTGDIIIRRAHAGDYDLVTGTGDVRFGIPEGVAAKLDLASGLGMIENRLSSSDAQPTADSYVTLGVKSGTGDVIVERAVPVA